MLKPRVFENEPTLRVIVSFGDDEKTAIFSTNHLE
jgi:hypothetical protein